MSKTQNSRVGSSINFYEFVKSEKVINPNYDKHGMKIPFRMLIAAPSGSGKTNALLNLILACDKTFHEIIVCVKSADEPLYRLLEDKLKDQVKFYENGEVPPLDQYSIKDAKGKLKRIDKLQRLIVFDDLILDKAANRMAAEYYIKARKLGFSSAYIGQSYYQIPKNIRDNCQMFILGRNLLKKDLRMILTIFPTEMTLDEFSNLYNELTCDPLDVINIDVERKIIRKNITGEAIKL